ncbi:hypothetical protein AK973_4808 [Pseudomonas brassicacearum]|nr:hypothetical protein AK973_4808 [Pseudomonas brassicacearum]
MWSSQAWPDALKTGLRRRDRQRVANHTLVKAIAHQRLADQRAPGAFSADRCGARIMWERACSRLPVLTVRPLSRASSLPQGLGCTGFL